MAFVKKGTGMARNIGGVVDFEAAERRMDRFGRRMLIILSIGAGMIYGASLLKDAAASRNFSCEIIDKLSGCDQASKRVRHK